MMFNQSTNSFVLMRTIKISVTLEFFSNQLFCTNLKYILLFHHRGRFSVIKRCLDAKTKKPFVAKIIKYEDDTDREDTLQEFDIHRSIKGDKVVMLRDAFLMRRYLVLVMDM